MIAKVRLATLASPPDDSDQVAASALSSVLRPLIPQLISPTQFARLEEVSKLVLVPLRPFHGSRWAEPPDQRPEPIECLRDRLAFPNLDPIYHNVFSYSKAKRFDLGRYAGDESRSVTFDKPGVVRVFCEIHSFMSATIVVLPAPWFCAIDEAGWFEMRDVPAGSYEILVWSEGESELVPLRPLTVAETDSVRMRLAP
jgi:hypothetical protein